MAENNTIITQELNQQVALLSEMIEQARQEMLANPNDRYRGPILISQLASNMNRLRKQVERLENDHITLMGLIEIGQAVNSSLELADLLRIVMDQIIRLTGAERGFLMLRETGGKQGDKLVTKVARNWEKESLNSTESAISQSVVQRVFKDGQPLLTTNAQEDPRFGSQESIIALSIRSILCVPLKVKEVITGVVYVDSRLKTGIFTDAKRNLLQAFANQAAVAIENARLFESLRTTLVEVTDLKNLMANVFSSIASGVITSNIQDTILLCNQAAEKILGQTQSEMVGSQLDQVLTPLFNDIAAQLETVRQTDRQLIGLEVNPTIPGRGTLTLSLNLSPLKDASATTQGLAIVMDDLTEKRRLEGQKRLFERMVSPKVIEQLNPDKLQLGGVRTQITTLFADVRGYTSFSEGLDPVQLVAVLNLYLKAAAEAVLAEDGTIDKFLGDAIMAWFNAPIPQADHSLRAVRAGLAISKSIKKLHASLPPQFHLQFGVGIHFGDAVLGLVGTETRLDYTAIGDSVNTAKRIQENAAGGQVLISEDVYQKVADKVLVKIVNPIRAKGKAQLITVYDVLDLNTQDTAG